MTLMSIDHARHPVGNSPRWLHRLLISAIGLLALTGSAFAGQLNLAWDGVSAAAGYRVYYGAASSAYTASQDVGNKTSAAVSGLTEGKKYYFAVQAYAGTVTSGNSNEVSAVVPTTTTATAPVASFTASSLNITTNQSVTLADTSTGGTVASRSWSLGAGASVSAPTALAAATVVTSYTSTGPKTVTLTVTGANGVKSSASKTINVTATAAPPVASFSATPTSGTAPLKVAFTDASSGSITGWSWSFGPTGATSTAQNPSYTYASPGTYTVSHTVTGPGGSSTKTSSITVSAPASNGGTSGGSTGSSSVSTTGLVAAYGFEETSGTRATDSSGKGNNGTLSNATRTTQGKFGRALSFNGSNSLVTVADNASLDLTSGMTLSAWVYPTSQTANRTTVIMKERSGGLAWSLSASSNVKRPNTTTRIGNKDVNVTGGSQLPINTWTHLAATFDGRTQILYVNGVRVAARAPIGTLNVSANPLRIGGNTVLANQYFKGLIDEVRVYNRALTQKEIAAVSQEPVAQTTQTAQSTQTASGTADAAVGATPVSTSGLVAAYGFDGTSATQALDASGNKNHGTLSNATRTTQGKFGRALSFNGKNSLVSVSDHPTLDLTKGMTLSAWVYPTSQTANRTTVIMKERSGGLAWSLNASSSVKRPNTTTRIGNKDVSVTGGSQLPINTWTHLAATFDGRTQILYVNGVRVAARAPIGTLNVSANPLRIGGNTVLANQYFKGLIDEVRVYNQALTQKEIAAVSREPVVRK